MTFVNFIEEATSVLWAKLFYMRIRLTALLILSLFYLPVIAQQVGQQTMFFTDSARKRPVVTEIWYPTADKWKPSDTINQTPFVREVTVRNAKPITKKHPLIMLSHGTGGGRLTMQWLAYGLAKKGYVVAAVDHYGNTYDNKNALDFIEIWKRPLDISFSLTQILNSPFRSLINTSKIGMAGFSLGGYTTIALAGAKLNADRLVAYATSPKGKKENSPPEYPDMFKNVDMVEVLKSFKKAPQLADKRFRSFVAMCPAVGQGFNSESQFENIKRPLLIIGAEADSLAPVKTNALHYHKLIKGSSYTEIKMAGHYIFLGEGKPDLKRNNPLLFVDPTGLDRKSIHNEVVDMVLLFFTKNQN